MANMANITIKKADGTTDITYHAQVASAGDQSPALWRANAVSPVPGFRPTFTLRTRDNGPRTARSFNSAFRLPVVVAINGVDTVVATIPIDVTGTLPTKVDASHVKEAIYQSGNLIVSALVRQSLEEGYAPV